ncbi:hypothetical protein [Sphingorhabdus contaminans]|uniref:hypothetical protein n=1 Tax=Sphingorhabdus contaminans TaxID=1343899 RepID=UPI003D2B098F
MTLDEESARATSLLRGKVVKQIVRHREQEVLIKFEDGSLMYADSEIKVEISILPID